MSTRTKKSCAAARIQNAAQVVDARGAIDRQPELRQLQRHVAADAGGDDPVEDRQVRARGGVRLRHGARRSRRADRAFAVMPAASIAARGRDRFLDRFAGDEPAREAVRAPHAVTRGELLECAAAGERVEESPGDVADHQCVVRTGTLACATPARAGAEGHGRSTAGRSARARETVRRARRG